MQTLFTKPPPTPPAPPPSTLPEWLLQLEPLLLPELLLPLAAGLALLVLGRLLWHPSVPRVLVPLEPDEAADVLDGTEPETPSGPNQVPCFDPSTGRRLGSVPAATAEDVKAAVAKARKAQLTWARSSFEKRRHLMRILSRCALEHAEDICRISARDSGKTTTDAAFGEVLVTLEKLSWLCAEGEGCLRPEKRSAGRMLFYKTARVEWHPRGVVGAIVPWNYPFHNILNPVRAPERAVHQSAGAGGMCHAAKTVRP